MAKKLSLTATNHTAPHIQARVTVTKKRVVKSVSHSTTKEQARSIAVHGHGLSQSQNVLRTVAIASVDTETLQLAIDAISGAIWAIYGPSTVELSPHVIKAKVTLVLDAVSKALDHCCCVVKKRWQC